MGPASLFRSSGASFPRFWILESSLATVEFMAASYGLMELITWFLFNIFRGVKCTSEKYIHSIPFKLNPNVR